MNIYWITKKQILFFFAIFFFLCVGISICFFIFAEQEVPSINTSSISLEDTQSKIDALYTNPEKVAYLTFDDGPTKVATPIILDILKEEKVFATFFVIGSRVEEFPNIVKRTYEEGHFIANHSYSHQNTKLYQSKTSFLNEIQKTDEAIAKALGLPSYQSHLFRFPNGSHTSDYAVAKKNAKLYLKEIGYYYVDWNALNNDSMQKYSSSELLQNLKNSCKGKNTLVILMHDTVDVSKSYTALQESIQFLKQEGYSFATFSSFFSDNSSF